MTADDPAAKAGARRSGQATRARLIAAALDSLRDRGIAGTSARTIAAAAGVNQALIFHHFGSKDALLAHACRQSTAQRVDVYRQRFDSVRSLRGLLSVGLEIHSAERVEGNVTVLAQLLAAGQTDPALGRVTAECLDLWVAEIEAVLSRVLADSPLAGVVDARSLSRAVAAAFVGLELYEGVDPDAASTALGALDHLGAIAEILDELGPLARRAVRSRLKTAQGPRPRRR